MAYILDTSRVNAKTVAQLQGRSWESRDFGFALVRELVTEHIRRRMEAPGVQTFVKLAAQCYLGKFSADKF